MLDCCGEGGGEPGSEALDLSIHIPVFTSDHELRGGNQKKETGHTSSPNEFPCFPNNANRVGWGLVLLPWVSGRVCVPICQIPRWIQMDLSVLDIRS